MAKKTVGLIIVLFLITVSLLYIAFVLKPKTAVAPQPSSPISQKDRAQTMLSFSPNPLHIASRSASLAVVIDTKENSATAVQLEISFDPTLIAVTNIIPATFFENPLVLAKNIDNKIGKLTYAIAIPPTGLPKKGTGIIATILFTINLSVGETTKFSFLPKTLVTAQGAKTSVLKTATGATISASGSAR